MIDQVKALIQNKSTLRIDRVSSLHSSNSPILLAYGSNETWIIKQLRGANAADQLHSEKKS